MRILGLTGNLGMGKSTVAALFRARGVPVHDADATVHELYQKEAAPVLQTEFPEAVVGGKVDRAILKSLLKTNEDWRKLEQLVHPLVRAKENLFLQNAKHLGAHLVVLDIPLLMETGGEKRCDVVMVVSAPAAVQKERALKRPGMTEEKFKAILAQQIPDEEKRRRAHIVINTGTSLKVTAREVDAILTMFSGR